MKTFHIDSQLDYDVLQQTLFVFNLPVPNTGTQRIRAEAVTTQPSLDFDEFADAVGANRFVRVNVPPGLFSVRYQATVDLDPPAVDELAPEIPLAEVPGAVLPYVMASKYCEADLLFALACREFGRLAPGYRRVQSVCQWIRDNIAYQIGTSSPLTTARDVLANRAGVCRDFAHLAVAFCRALNIPARFVTGYARYADPPPDFHAVFEAYLGDRWYLFDPTRLSPLDEIVRIGTGRDAAEVAFATFFGAARMRRLAPLIEPAEPGTELVSLQSPAAGILLAA
ncbi:MAG: transglutaminase family protein [Betaproteobacteria bacterium]|nr:MAG: transglutaminase family protein [Betaproteobacteria bacterium]